MSFIRRIYSRNLTNLRSVNHFSQSTHSEVAWKDARPFEDIPGPRSAFGLFRLMAPGAKYYNKSINLMFEMMRKDIGDVIYFPGMIGQSPFIALFNPDDFEKVYRNEGKYPYRRSLESLAYFRKEYCPDLFKGGKGLLIEHGQSWYDFRTKVNQIMMQPRNVKMYIPANDEVAKDFVKKVRRIMDENKEVPADFNDSLIEYTLESIALIALDTRLNLLNGSNEKAVKLHKLMKELSENTFKFDFEPSIWRYYKTAGFLKAMQTLEEGTRNIVYHIDKAIEKFGKNQQRSSDHESVLEKLLKVDKNVAKVMAIDMIGAGVETTAESLVGVIYALATNQDKQEILREEVFRVLPEKSSNLTSKSLDHVPYMRAVIKEALRLYPVFSANSRRIETNVVLSGYQVPKGQKVLMVNSAHYDFFGEPEKFIPERWLKDNYDPKCPHARKTHPFANLPFGFGSRMCIGRRFAEMEIAVLVARLLREFKIEWNHSPLKFKFVFLIYPDSPLKFKFTEI